MIRTREILDTDKNTVRKQSGGGRRWSAGGGRFSEQILTKSRCNDTEIAARIYLTLTSVDQFKYSQITAYVCVFVCYVDLRINTKRKMVKYNVMVIHDTDVILDDKDDTAKRKEARPTT